jgi:hypothetical protein
MVAAYQVLLNCLEEIDAVLPGQFNPPKKGRIIIH